MGGIAAGRRQFHNSGFQHSSILAPLLCVERGIESESVL